MKPRSYKRKVKKECYKNLSEEEKDKIKEYQKKYQELVEYKKDVLKNKKNFS